MVRLATTGLAAALVVVLAVAGAAAFGLGPFPATSSTVDDSGTATPTPAPTATPDAAADGGGGGGSDDGGSDDGGGGDGGSAEESTATPQPDPFQFTVGAIENCGTTCRDVTASVTNVRQQAVQDVTVTTVITTEGDQVWQGDADLGTLDAGETVETTRRVNIGYFDAAKIKNNGGYITVETTIQSSAGEYTFSERRKVA
jgi:hypothetical protein